jgi:hypothetical protein
MASLPFSAVKTRVVVATRETQEGFFSQTATGKSLARMAIKPIEIRIFPENRRGLPDVYNQALRESADDPAILVFLHDDVHLLDYFAFERISEGLKCFDLLGVAGNKRRLPRQPSWAFIDTNCTWDATEHLSGIVAHGKHFPPDNISIYGPSRQAVKLLDGVILAAKSNTLLQNHIFFDERFTFHFYDLDICRQAEINNLICGTWDIALMHESGGSFQSPDWALGLNEYYKKWE